MTELTEVFQYESHSIRTIMKDGEPWFVASDVCGVLGLTTSHAVNGQFRPNESEKSGGIDEDEKGVHIVHTPGGPQEVLIVNEPGLYTLILKSRTPKAKTFKRWITHEVIPAIRKTGTYTMKTSIEDLIIMQAQSVKELKARVSNVETTTQQLTHRVDNLDLANIEGTTRQRLSKMMRLYALNCGIPYPVAWRHFDTAYNTAFHTNITRRRNACARKMGRLSIPRPEYLEIEGTVEDGIRVVSQMLNMVREAAVAQ